MATRAQKRAAAIALSLARLSDPRFKTSNQKEAYALSRPETCTGMTEREAAQYLEDHRDALSMYRSMYPGPSAEQEFDALADKIIAAIVKARRNRLLTGEQFYDIHMPAVIEKVTGQLVPRYWDETDCMAFGEPPEGAELAA